MPIRRKSATPRWLWPTLGLVAAGLLGWSLTARFLHLRAERIADAKAWTITGPPCARITEAELAADAGKGLRRFDHGGVTFFRREGDVECAPVYYDGGRGDGFYPVCQFTGPGDLKVSTAEGQWRFRPGPGRPATVSVPHGRAACVTAVRIGVGKGRG